MNGMQDCSIEIKDVSVKFGSYTALDRLNVEIAASSFVSIVGPNGGGKSTLLKLMLGLIEPGEGEVRLFGRRPMALDPALLGYVPQIKTLDRSFPARAFELVATGVLGKWPHIMDKGTKKRSLEALDSVGALHIARRPLSKLSGGELQRVYLARCLVKKPQLLILDEPSTGIDLKGEKDISHIIDEFHTGTKATIIMVTHDWESAYHHSDRVLLLNRELICFDEPECAFREDNLRRAFGHEGHKHDMIFGVHRHE